MPQFFCMTMWGHGSHFCFVELLYSVKFCVLIISLSFIDDADGGFDDDFDKMVDSSVSRTCF